MVLWRPWPARRISGLGGRRGRAGRPVPRFLGTGREARSTFWGTGREARTTFFGRAGRPVPRFLDGSGGPCHV